MHFSNLSDNPHLKIKESIAKFIFDLENESFEWVQKYGFDKKIIFK